ncbi:outer membrane protein assembly factor BamA [Endothiovibrio diazotrophicus]
MTNNHRGLRLAPLAALMLWGASALAADDFAVSDIRIEGLQRISAGTVFNYLPVKVGQRLDEKSGAEAIRALFKTGFFKDVRLERDGDVLVILVQERPAVASIELSGNKDIDKDQLLEALKQIGLAEGRVFNRSLLDTTEKELRRQYFNRGKYAVKITPTVTPLERNRVGVTITVDEGEAARIRAINLVGNHVFPTDELLDEFQLTTGNWMSWITDDNQYSKEKLTADLESLRSYYLDRGYINFNITSTQVTITPDKHDIYITINVSEGEEYTVKEVKLAGELVVPQDELFGLVKLHAGDTFSRRDSTKTSAAISDRLGQEGYAFANVNAIPDVDEKEKQVSLTFFVDPGKRVYVRRINMVNNTKTRDEVLRREMRQMEGAWIDTAKVNRSRDRLDVVGYFDGVNVETKPVPGTTDQVDVEFSVKEKPSGNLMAGIGYSSGSGVIFSTSITQENFMGSGKRLGFSFNNSDVNTVYSVSYLNPYYTVDGVSRGFSLYSRETDAEAANISRYVLDNIGGNVTWGVPINEYDKLLFTLGLDQKSVTTGATPSVELADWLAANGNDFLGLNTRVGWSHDTRNSAIFPDRGTYLAAGAGMTFGELTYYDINLKAQRYFPLNDDWTVMGNVQFQYGDGVGGTDALPYYEYFLAGGVKSVRGFRDNTLGPHDSNGDTMGGDVKLVGNAELLLPPLFWKESSNFRMSAFLDAGNVWGVNQEVDLGDLRYSTGLTATWLSPFGPLTFVVATPLNDKGGDETQSFQFTMGRQF